MSITCPFCKAVAGKGHELGHKSNCPSVTGIIYRPEDMINACHEAHQGGSDFILCNLICLISDFKAKNMDRESILKKLDEFIERFK